MGGLEAEGGSAAGEVGGGWQSRNETEVTQGGPVGVVFTESVGGRAGGSICWTTERVDDT